MKKYRLITPYPGSPELGSIYEKIKGFWNSGQIMYKNLSKDGCCLNSKIIENNPGYWEEIVEKDYEILSFKNINNGYICNLVKDDVFYCKTLKQSSDLTELLRVDFWNINSVKRLSDGEVFTVGDKINGGDDFKLQIQSFEIFKNHVRINKYAYPLSIYNHSKKPLFTTEDGVDIYPKKDGEFQYWSLKLDNWKISNAPHILNSNKINPTKTEDLLRCCNELRFSTKEAAEEYILMNKPYLSLKEVFTIYPYLKKNSHNLTAHAQKLTNFVKSKL